MDIPVREIRQFIMEREQEMFALLERMVRINSHTPNKAGADAVGAVVREVMESMGFSVRVDRQSEVGDNIIAESPACALAEMADERIMFCGHMDTVFPNDGSFDCFDRQGENIVGPGVIDMKGGLVTGIYALKALNHVGLLGDMPVAFLFNSDEETGSLHSRDLVMAEAKKACLAFVFECSGLNGELVTGRKGKTTFQLEAKGKAGHSGGYKGDKPSAILELAHATIALEKLNDPDSGISLNVGLVKGGIGPNTVAPAASATAECRYVSAEDGDRIRKAVEQIAASPQIPGTSLEVAVIPGRPPMERGPEIATLFEKIRAAGDDLGITVNEEFRGGVSDANYISFAGTPVLDGMGPSGDLDHSPSEYMIADTLASSALLTAVGVRRCFEAYKAGTLFRAG